MKKDLGELQGKIFLHRWSLKKNNGTKWASQAKLDRTKKFWDLFLRIFYCDYQSLIYLTREKCDQKIESFDYNAAIAINGAILNETISKNWARILFKTRLTELQKYPCEILSPNTCFAYFEWKYCCKTDTIIFHVQFLNEKTPIKNMKYLYLWSQLGIIH